MEIVRFFVGQILPYVAVAVFLVGMIWQFRTWRRLASPAMTLFPAPRDEAANLRNVLKEALLFPSLFRGDRVLWLFSWVFHATLLLILLGHLRVFTNVDSLLMAFGMSEESIQTMSSVAGGAAGVVILVAVALILTRRMAVQRVREITGVVDVFALSLIGAIIITGDLMRFGAEHFDLTLTREYFVALATFSSVAGMEALKNNTFVLHMFLALLLILMIPFSKILHFGGIFFTQQLIRKQ